MTITITISSGSSGTDDSELQAIVAKCVKKSLHCVVFMGYNNRCAIYCLVLRVSRLAQ